MNKIILFDLDGTLVASGQQITTNMHDILSKLSNNYTLGIVGGGTYEKISQQLDTSIALFKYIFSECGSVVHMDNKLVEKNNMLDNMSFEDRLYLNKIIKYALYLISKLDIIFHGNQIDFRNGLIYISPPGMQATSFERNIFIELDKKSNIRDNLILLLKLQDYQNRYDIVLGGHVGIAIYKKGSDKSQVMKYFPDTIYFFGDKTDVTGNDYPIFSHDRVVGHTVVDPTDTMNQLLNFL